MTDSTDLIASDVIETIARLKIADMLTRYSRGIDRCDIDTLLQTFWPDGTCDYGSGVINAHEWSRNTVEGLKRMLRTQHATSNMAIDIDGDKARSETYCQAYHEVDGPDGRVEMVVGGRYLDRIEKRDGVWKVFSRVYVMDWNRNIPSTCEWTTGIYANLNNRGSRWPEDMLKAFVERA
jgi:hypothetical protein